MFNFAIFTFWAFCQISPYLGPSYETSVEDNGFILVSTSTSYVDAVTLDSYATVVVLVKERKRKIVKLEEPGIVKR